MLTIDPQIARRFILGKQGLWPGRRWQGPDGVVQAMQQMEYLQLDPLQIISRSQDIQLHGRVLDYTPGMWEIPTYQQRRFFDWGGWLAVRPMHELPYWRVMMHHERDNNPRHQATLHEHHDAIVEMRHILQQRGTVSNRDFSMTDRKRTDSYRGRKDSAIALYYLWRTGEVMIHHRQKFERVYALTEAVAPAELIYEHDILATDRYLLKKEVGFNGLSRLNKAPNRWYRGMSSSQIRQLGKTLLTDGEFVEVQVEGWKAPHYAQAADVPLLEHLLNGRVPPAWTPLQTNTTEEATFLAPLEPVSARGRAKTLFDFDYSWEVYKPADKRQFGYYTLPILWGDQLVGRFDSKLDRNQNRFIILGLWLEDEQLAHNQLFSEALARGFARFITFLGTDQLDATAVVHPTLQKRLAAL